jgi:hypothetical protein
MDGAAGADRFIGEKGALLKPGFSIGEQLPTLRAESFLSEAVVVPAEASDHQFYGLALIHSETASHSLSPAMVVITREASPTFTRVSSPSALTLARPRVAATAASVLRKIS